MNKSIFRIPNILMVQSELQQIFEGFSQLLILNVTEAVLNQVGLRGLGVEVLDVNFYQEVLRPKLDSSYFPFEVLRRLADVFEAFEVLINSSATDFPEP